MDRAPADERPHDLERETLLRVRDRDPRAMNRFFEAYYRRVHGYAARLLRDSVLAEDLTQEAFLRMHAALDRLDPDRNPTGWVFRIVTNTLRDYWRSRTHRAAARNVSLDEAWQLPSPDPRSDPAEQLDAKEMTEAVRRAMARLSPADREILLLRTFRELETEEIVSILSITAEAARQRHSRAVKRLGAEMRRILGMPPRGTEEER